MGRWSTLQRSRAAHLNGPDVVPMRGRQQWPNDWTVMPCWCEASMFRVPPGWVKEGRAPTCGLLTCETPA